MNNKINKAKKACTSKNYGNRHKYHKIINERNNAIAKLTYHGRYREIIGLLKEVKLKYSKEAFKWISEIVDADYYKKDFIQHLYQFNTVAYTIEQMDEQIKFLERRIKLKERT